MVNIDNAIARAQKLILDENWMAQVEYGAAQERASNGNGKGSNDLAAFEAQAFGSVTTNKPIQMLQEKSDPFSTSKMPKEVLESFKKNPSVFAEQPSYSLQQQTVQQPQSSQIDYNYIKYIVNECIKENMKGMLNESAGGTMPAFRGMRITNGSVIQFLDTKGNLYEGKLVLKKKAK